ncbi:MAG: hypothetical protein V1877_00885 [Candidatus Tagabacteria bacterium]
MKKIILLVEDLADEQVKAKQAVTDEGYRFVVASTLAEAKKVFGMVKIDGIVTDLHFPESEYDKNANNACGFAVIVVAIKNEIPVAVCSNVNHHFAEYVKDVIAFLETVSPFKKIPFVMDSKDWVRAIKEIKNLIEKEV